MRQARAINEKVGYPDYLDGDNVTQLEKDYAEVRRFFALFIIDPLLFCSKSSTISPRRIFKMF